MSKPSLGEILAVLRSWKLEANNPRNDGWVQESYRAKIKRVFCESGKLLNKK
jgi:hypothetical protein